MIPTKPNPRKDYHHTDSDINIYRHECATLGRYLRTELTKVITILPRHNRIPSIIADIFNTYSHWKTLPDHLMYALNLYLNREGYQFANSITNGKDELYLSLYMQSKRNYNDWIDVIDISY